MCQRSWRPKIVPAMGRVRCQLVGPPQGEGDGLGLPAQSCTSFKASPIFPGQAQSPSSDSRTQFLEKEEISKNEAHPLPYRSVKDRSSVHFVTLCPLVPITIERPRPRVTLGRLQVSCNPNGSLLFLCPDLPSLVYNMIKNKQKNH